MGITVDSVEDGQACLGRDSTKDRHGCRGKKKSWIETYIRNVRLKNEVVCTARNLSSYFVSCFVLFLVVLTCFSVRTLTDEGRLWSKRLQMLKERFPGVEITQEIMNVMMAIHKIYVERILARAGSMTGPDQIITPKIMRIAIKECTGSIKVESDTIIRRFLSTKRRGPRV